MKRGMLNQRSEQDASASNKDGGIGTQIHLKLTQLVQNIFCVQLSRITNCLFYRIWQYRFLPLQHCTDMLVFNAHVVLRADFAYNNRPMSIVIRNVFVYPQAYAAVVPQSGQLLKTLRMFIVDIGGRKLLGNGKERQDKVSIISGLVSHIGQALPGERPVFPVVLQNLLCHRRFYGVFCQPGNEGEMRGFNGIISMIMAGHLRSFLLS